MKVFLTLDRIDLNAELARVVFIGSREGAEDAADTIPRNERMILASADTEEVICVGNWVKFTHSCLTTHIARL